MENLYNILLRHHFNFVNEEKNNRYSNIKETCDILEVNILLDINAEYIKSRNKNLKKNFLSQILNSEF